MARRQQWGQCEGGASVRLPEALQGRGRALRKGSKSEAKKISLPSLSFRSFSNECILKNKVGVEQ